MGVSKKLLIQKITQKIDNLLEEIKRLEKEINSVSKFKIQKLEKEAIIKKKTAEEEIIEEIKRLEKEINSVSKFKIQKLEKERIRLSDERLKLKQQ